MQCKIIQAIAVIVATFFVLMVSPVSAAPVDVQVKGVSQNGDVIEAMHDAQRKAVQRMLSCMIAADDNPQSLYQQILSGYVSYSKKPVIIRKQMVGGKLYLLSKVTVDSDKLRERLKSEVAQKQRQRYDNVAFVVRIQGVPENERQARQNSLQKVFSTTFKNIGLDTAVIDGATDLMAVEPRGTYDDFVNQVKGQLTKNVAVSLAVIGEVTVENATQNGDGNTLQANVHLTEYVMSSDSEIGGQAKEISDFQDKYLYQGDANVTEAVLYKAALNSSKTLAERTLQYWNGRK